jgi:hypothetical protein
MKEVDHRENKWVSSIRVDRGGRPAVLSNLWTVLPASHYDPIRTFAAETTRGRAVACDLLTGFVVVLEMLFAAAVVVAAVLILAPAH